MGPVRERERKLTAATSTGSSNQKASQAALLVGLLTTRGREVLRLLVGVTRSAEIAEALTASQQPLRAHLRSLLTLQVHSPPGAEAFDVRLVSRIPGPGDGAHS